MASKTGGKRVYREWEEWYADAKAYYETFGDLLVPAGYVTDDGFRLGRWIERQRGAYNGTTRHAIYIDGTRIKLLEKIGMVWKLENRFKWSVWMELVEKYHSEHGDLHVPRDYFDGDVCLGNWIVEQRKKYHAGKLTDKQIKDLDRYGMIWEFGHHRTWDDWFQDCQKYYEEHGNLLVPYGYCIEAGDLFVWIDSQRSKYKGNRGVIPLTEDQIQRLDSIGMIWDLNEIRTDAWEQMYGFVKAYKDEHGKLPTWPRGMTAPNGKRMDHWVSAQRQALDQGKVLPERVERLAAIGITKPRKYKVSTGGKTRRNKTEDFDADGGGQK